MAQLLEVEKVEFFHNHHYAYVQTHALEITLEGFFSK